MLRIDPKTSKKFGVDEQVKLRLTTKNIADITVNVYPIDLEKVHLMDIEFSPENVDLSCLYPAHTSLFKIQGSNPYVERQSELRVENIGKNRGMWVVELLSGEISARAVILKGGIHMVHRNTASGVQLKFYDESLEQIKKLHVWINNKRHEIRDSYTIPYNEKE